MTIFYVYMKWHRATTRENSRIGRILLICESRYVADELFRALQTVRGGNNGHLRFSLMERRTPQFWSYDTYNDERWDAIVDILGTTSLLPQFGTSVMCTLLHDWGGRVLNIIPAVDGPDWIHNGNFFIRNKRQPNLYWYNSEGSIQVSDKQKTKFRIRATKFKKDDQVVLIRSDTVEILMFDNSCHPSYLNRGVGCKNLHLSLESREWKFGDFLGGFGTTWEKKGNTMQELVTWTDDEDGDNWELC